MTQAAGQGWNLMTFMHPSEWQYSEEEMYGSGIFSGRSTKGNIYNELSYLYIPQSDSASNLWAGENSHLNQIQAKLEKIPPGNVDTQKGCL